jgi:AcrR family transcriptional regulator
VTRTHDVAAILRSAAPGHFAEDRVGDALADVVHRSLFGVRDGVNVHGPPPQRPPVLRFDPGMRAAFARGGPPPELSPAGRETWETLLEAGRKVFAERGYHRTRVGDVAEAAGVSRAAFYRYFEDKEGLARALTTRAVQTVSLVFAELPASVSARDTAGRAALRRWLRRYDLAQVGEAAMLRVWVDAALQDAALRASAAPALDWGRRAMASFLARRGFGDAETEAVVMLALLSAFGARERSPSEVEAAARIVEQGLVGIGGG